MKRPKALCLVSTLCLIASLASGCASADHASKTDCAPYRDPFSWAKKHEITSFPLTMLLIDVRSNGPKEAEEVGEALRPYLAEALEKGEYLAMEADGGRRTEVVASRCFAGVAGGPFWIKSGNDPHDQDDRRDDAEVLVKATEDFVRSVRVSGSGSVSRLLAQIPNHVADMRVASVGKIRVVVYSDLLGNGDTRDCLSLDGISSVQTTADMALRIVDRCVSAGQLAALNVDEFLIVGAGHGAPTSEQALLATHLRDALCARLAAGCRTRTGGS